MDNTKESRSFEFQEYRLLLGYMDYLLRFKYRVVVLSIVFSGCVFTVTLLMDEKFSAEATVAINISEKPGGVSPNDYRGANTFGVIEYDFIIDGSHSNERERHLARMQSYGFISQFIQDYQLLPWLYPARWSDQDNGWTDNESPDMREAVKKFKKHVLYIESNKKTELLDIRITAESPSTASEMANNFVKKFNSYVQKLEISELEGRRSYLEKRLSEVQNTEVHRSIYRLLEAQLAVESLLFARDNYPLEIIQPATDPLFESYPRRKQWTALSMIAAIFVGYGIIVAHAIVAKVYRDLQSFRGNSLIQKESIEGSGRAEWVNKNQSIDS